MECDANQLVSRMLGLANFATQRARADFRNVHQRWDFSSLFVGDFEGTFSP